MTTVLVLPCPCCGGEAFYSPADHSVRADGRVSCRDRYLEVEESHSSDPAGSVLAAAHHGIHTQSILFEAWDRVKALPIIKSMHSETRGYIRRAIFG